MWLVERAQIGAVAYGRLQRDGAIRTLIPGLALPHDVPDSPSVRRAALHRCVPAGCQVTGLGALWAAGLAPSPHALDVRTTVGRHIRNWQPRLPLTFHAVGLALSGARPSASDGTSVTDVGVGIADALRWAPLAQAIPAAAQALWGLEGEARTSLIDEVELHLGSHSRALTAWQAVKSGQPA